MLCQCSRNEPLSYRAQRRNEQIGGERTWLAAASGESTCRYSMVWGERDNIQQALWSPLTHTGTRILCLTGLNMPDHNYALTYLPARPPATKPPQPSTLPLCPPSPLIYTPPHLLYLTLIHWMYLYIKTLLLMFSHIVLAIYVGLDATATHYRMVLWDGTGRG